MMTRRERAKQFLPFDSLKGLQEALRDREERHARVERHGIGEEEQAALNRALSYLAKGCCVRVSCHCDFHDTELTGKVTELNYAKKYLCLNGKKLLFEDLYALTLTDAEPCE